MKGPQRPPEMQPRAWRRPEPDPRDVQSAHDAIEQARKRRDQQVWNVVVGMGLLFAGGIHYGLAVGGVLMIAYGGVMYLVWSQRAKADDPWHDPEIDAWEEEHFGR